jgi:hypothetical protein
LVPVYLFVEGTDSDIVVIEPNHVVWILISSEVAKDAQGVSFSMIVTSCRLVCGQFGVVMHPTSFWYIHSSSFFSWLLFG